MARKLGLALLIAATGVAGAAAWAAHAGRAPAIAQFLRLDPAPDYRLRLELPPVQSAGVEATTLSNSQAPADGLDQVPLAADRDKPSAAASSEFNAAFNPRTPMLDVTFDISTVGKGAPAGRERAVRAKKAVILRGDRLGSVELTVGQGSIVLVDRDSLRTLVAGTDGALAAALADTEGALVSFDALRDRGVRIRYDALADAVVIDSGS